MKIKICGITKIEDAILESIIPNTYEDAFEYMMKIKDEVLKD